MKQQETIIQLQTGTIKGKLSDHALAFLGIPYAKPPIGELRFRKTQKPDPWEGIKDCTSYSPICCQPKQHFDENKMEVPQSEENSLTLNVFTPACDNKKRPVVFWIHGGGFRTGAACGPQFNADKLAADFDMVVVTIQYRLNVLGFLDFTETSGANGRFDKNCGLWDQVTAFEWVEDNIAFFGGNPQDIGIMGESAGGCSVLTLLAIPQLKGKIKRAVAISPVPHFMQTKENARYAVNDYLQVMGIPEENSYLLADLPVETLIQGCVSLGKDYLNRRPFFSAFAPVVDDVLLPELPYDAILNGCADGIPMILGITKDEGTTMVKPNEGGSFPFTSEQMDIYFKDHPFIDKEKALSLYPDYPSLHAFQEIAKDVVFLVPTMELVEHLAAYGPVYMYQYDYAPVLLRQMNLGAAHAMPTGLISGYPNFMFDQDRDHEATLSNQIRNFWGNFLTTGNPNSNKHQDWPEYNNEKNVHFFDLPTSRTQKAPYTKQLDNWKKLRIYGN